MSYREKIVGDEKIKYRIGFQRAKYMILRQIGFKRFYKVFLLASVSNITSFLLCYISHFIKPLYKLTKNASTRLASIGIFCIDHF